MPERDVTTVEIWKPIPLVDGWYEASNLGRIRRTETATLIGDEVRNVKSPVLIKPSLNRHTGYMKVAVYIPEQGPFYSSVHRLVADAFHGARPTDYDINHIDSDRLNNRPENLEYVTRSQNHLHAYRTNGRKVSGRAKSLQRLSDDDVRTIRADYATGNFSYATLSEKHGINRWYVRELIKNRSRKLM